MKSIQSTPIIKTVLCSMVIAVSLLSFKCSNGDEKLKEDIIGTFYYSFNEEDEDIMATVEGRETFDADGQVRDEWVMALSTFDEDMGKITMKYHLSLTGKYDIKESYLIYDYDINDLKIVPVNSNAANGREYVEAFNSIMRDHMIPGIKQELMENYKVEIVELNDSRLITKDKDGEETVYKREAVSGSNNYLKKGAELKAQLYLVKSGNDYCNDNYIINNDETDIFSSGIHLDGKGIASIKYYSDAVVGEYTGTYKEGKDEIVCTFTKDTYYTQDDENDKTRKINRTIMVKNNPHCDKYPIYTQETRVIESKKEVVTHVGMIIQ